MRWHHETIPVGSACFQTLGKAVLKETTVQTITSYGSMDCQVDMGEACFMSEQFPSIGVSFCSPVIKALHWTWGGNGVNKQARAPSSAASQFAVWARQETLTDVRISLWWTAAYEESRDDMSRGTAALEDGHIEYLKVRSRLLNFSIV